MTKDIIQRFVFKNRDVRGSFVHLDDSYQTILLQHHYPPILAGILGEALVGICLMAPNFKTPGKITLQFQGEGDLRLLSVRVTSDFKIRGLVRAEPDLVSNLNLEHALSAGHLTLSYEPDQGKGYQSIIPIEKDSIAQALEDYFLKSEQLPTHFFIARKEGMVAGFMLQSLPNPNNDGAYHDLEHCLCMAETLKDEELLDLNLETILHRLFVGDDILVLEEQNVEFSCNCTRERMSGIVLNLGRDEVASILDERGFVEVTCEFCGQEHQFDQSDIESLFKGGPFQDGGGGHQHPNLQ